MLFQKPLYTFAWFLDAEVMDFILLFYTLYCNRLGYFISWLNNPCLAQWEKYSGVSI